MQKASFPGKIPLFENTERRHQKGDKYYSNMIKI